MIKIAQESIFTIHSTKTNCQFKIKSGLDKRSISRSLILDFQDSELYNSLKTEDPNSQEFHLEMKIPE